MKTLTCINCPLGCQITVTTDAQGENHFDGYGCKRGLTYAQAELTHPTRTITSTVRSVGRPGRPAAGENGCADPEREDPGVHVLA